jgi:hypothetical protein
MTWRPNRIPGPKVYKVAAAFPPDIEKKKKSKKKKKKKKKKEKSNNPTRIWKMKC